MSARLILPRLALDLRPPSLTGESSMAWMFLSLFLPPPRVGEGPEKGTRWTQQQTTTSHTDSVFGSGVASWEALQFDAQ